MQQSTHTNTSHHILTTHSFGNLLCGLFLQFIDRVCTWVKLVWKRKWFGVIWVVYRETKSGNVLLTNTFLPEKASQNERVVKCVYPRNWLGFMRFLFRFMNIHLWCAYGDAKLTQLSNSGFFSLIWLTDLFYHCFIFDLVFIYKYIIIFQQSNQ